MVNQDHVFMFIAFTKHFIYKLNKNYAIENVESLSIKTFTTLGKDVKANSDPNSFHTRSYRTDTLSQKPC